MVSPRFVAATGIKRHTFDQYPMKLQLTSDVFPRKVPTVEFVQAKLQCLHQLTEVCIIPSVSTDCNRTTPTTFIQGDEVLRVF